MEVTVRYFAGLREAAGSTRETHRLPDGGTVALLRETLEQERPVLVPLLGSAAVAVNQRIARSEQILAEGDEVAFLPPVSGG